jgi:hypothetical protein
MIVDPNEELPVVSLRRLIESVERLEALLAERKLTIIPASKLAKSIALVNRSAIWKRVRC